VPCPTWELFSSHVWRSPAIHCDTLQHSATPCDTLQHSATLCSPLQHSATLCNTLQHSVIHSKVSHVTRGNEACHTTKGVMSHVWMILSHNRVSHATHVNKSCHATDWTTSPHATQATCEHTLQHTATLCTVLWSVHQTTTHCNILQHTATHFLCKTGP